MKGKGEEEALSLFPPTSYLFLFSLLAPTFLTNSSVETLSRQARTNAFSINWFLTHKKNHLT